MLGLYVLATAKVLDESREGRPKEFAQALIRSRQVAVGRGTVLKVDLSQSTISIMSCSRGLAGDLRGALDLPPWVRIYLLSSQRCTSS